MALYEKRMTCTAAPAATLPGTTSGGTGGRPERPQRVLSAPEPGPLRPSPHEGPAGGSVLPPVDPPHPGPGPAGHPAAGCKRAGPLRAARRCSILGSPASAAGSGTPPAGRTTAPPAPRSGDGETAAPPHEGTAPGGPARAFSPRTPCPQNGVADVRHVDPDLVGAPGLQSALHIGIAGEPLQHGPVGHRAPAARHHRHLLPVRRVAADGGVHRAAVLPEIPRSRCTGKSGPGCGPEAGRRASGGRSRFFAAMRRPEVSRSIRWTMPGRAPPMPERGSPRSGGAGR